MYTVKVTIIPVVNCRPCVSCISWVNISAEIRFLEATENLLWEGGVRGEDMERNEIFMPVWAVGPWLRMKRGSRLSLEMGPTGMMKREGSQGFHCTSRPWVFIWGLSFNHPLVPTQISLPQLGLAFHIQTFILNGHRHFVSHWYLKFKTTETELFIFRYGSLLSHVSCLGTMAFSHQDPPSHQDHWNHVWVPRLSFSNSTTNSIINQ